jgi:hypothetical protein
MRIRVNKTKLIHYLSSFYFHCNSENSQLKSKQVSSVIYIYGIPPDDGLQIWPKHIEVDWRNKLRINSVFLFNVLFLFNTVIYVFLFLFPCILIVCLCIFIVPAGTLRVPWLRFFRAFSSVVRQMPGYNSQRWATARTLPKIFVLFYVFFFCFVSFCVLYACKCVLNYCHRVATQLQFNKYIISWS